MILLSDLLKDDSQAVQQAKRMGLVYKRFGRWADPRTDKVTHYTKDGVLRKVGSGELEAPAMTRRPTRSRADLRAKGGRSVPTKTPTTVEKQPVVPVEQKKTKEDPSFEELGKAAEEHQYTVVSQDRIESIRSVPSSKQPESDWKPNGFWFGVRDSWIDWMEGEAPHWKGDNLYSLDIDESKCLVIETNEQFLEFSKKYRTKGNIGNVINWKEVAQDHSGIVIKKYFDEYRMDTTHAWYYTWDAASGCVWDNTAISSVEQVQIK
jgi:hypothetical protein